MKKHWLVIKGCLTAAAIGILIIDSKTALAGAQKGVALCIQTVIPSLFPFFVLSILLTGAIIGHRIPILRPFGRIFGIPEGAEGLLAAGLLGGYPVGAQCVSQTFERGWVSGTDARRMLAICNNCGPAFLFGMAGAVFEVWYLPWLLWGIQTLSSLILARLLYIKGGQLYNGTISDLSLIQSLNRALRVMAAVCGWVILFRVVIVFLEGWFLWMLPLEVQVAISGILELSNGCFELLRLENLGLRFVLCAGMLSFGGICVTLQTAAVTSENLDKRLYFPGKLFQGGVSMILAWLLQLAFPAPHRCKFSVPICAAIITITAFSAVMLVKIKNSSSIPEMIGV